MLSMWNRYCRNVIQIGWNAFITLIEHKNFQKIVLYTEITRENILNIVIATMQTHVYSSYKDIQFTNGLNRL